MFKRKSNYDSFDDFHQFSKYVKEAANYLHESLIDFDVSKLEEKLKTMHEIENNCDIHHHDTNAKLLGQYLPVIASEDVLKLNDLLDDIVDDIEDILIGIYTFNVLNIRSQAVAFSEVIIELSNALCEATSEFKNFKKSKSITRRLNDVNKLEQKADKIYIEEMHRLHAEEDNIKKLVMWTRVYDLFEDAADSFEEVIKQMESIILKYK